MSFSVVIRGPLGIGKTTVARRLAVRLSGLYVSIDRILEEHDLEEWAEGYISVESFLRANAFALRLARPALRQGTPVVFDGNFYWQAALVDLLEQLGVRTYVFTLEAPFGVCLERDRHRPRPLGAEAVRDVYTKATEFGWGIPVDADRPLAEVVAGVRAFLPAIRRRVQRRTGRSRPPLRRPPASPTGVPDGGKASRDARP